MADVDAGRARRLMAAHGIAALVVVKPENVQYVTGVHPGPASSLWRRAGPAIALLPADEAQAPAAIVPDTQAWAFARGSAIRDLRTHPLWIETDDVTGLLGQGRPIEDVIREAAGRRPKPTERPGTYDLRLILDHLAELVHERGLDQEQLGIELDFIAANDLRAFQQHLPRVRFVDSSMLIYELRAIKNRREIAAFRVATELSEAGIMAALGRLELGMTAAEVALAYRIGVNDAARVRGVAHLEATWDIISVGPRPWGEGMTTARVEPGALLKFDVGCIVGGCESDIGRTFAFGSASAEQHRVHEGLERAHAAGRAQLRPDTPVSAVFRAAIDGMRAAGFPSYTRGHFGHSIGSDFGHEEWPYIAAAEATRLAPGMLFAFETPYYVDGLGGFIVEDHILITEDGHENLNTMPRELTVVG